MDCRDVRRHTHDLVDQVFSRFSVWLNHNDVWTVEELAEGLKKAYTPAPNVMSLKRSLDVKSWLGDACPPKSNVEGVTAPHYFIIEKDPELVQLSSGNQGRGGLTTGIRHAEWTNTKLSPFHHILQEMPAAAPRFLPGRHLFYRDGRSEAAMDKMLKAMEDQVKFHPMMSQFYDIQ